MCLSLAIHRPECVLSSGFHKGFQWTTVHNTSGYRCGYIRLPEGHPWHGKHYDDVNVEVHGGLTFSEPDEECDAPGNDDAWWLGFDCAHGCDAADYELPGDHHTFRKLSGDYAGPRYADRGTIRTQEYVENECKSLCEQAEYI